MSESPDRKTIALASLLTVFIVFTAALAIFCSVLLVTQERDSSAIPVIAKDSPQEVTAHPSEQQQLARDLDLYRERSLQLEKLMLIRRERGEGRYKLAFLTFDDGPSANTPLVLDILDRYGIKATFFVFGTESEMGLSLYQRIVTDGHVLANHTYSHEYGSIYQSPQSFWKDFYQLEEVIYNATGTRPLLMRFPGGSNNQVSRKAGGRGVMRHIRDDMSSRGYFYVDWDIESGDASRYFRSSDFLYKRVIGNLEYYDDAVILFHDTKRNTPLVDALPRIIETMIAQGYVFLPITEAYYPLMPQFQ